MTNRTCCPSPWVLATLALTLLAAPGSAAAPAAAPALSMPSPPRITGVVVRVVDLERALQFYREVGGFETVQVERTPGGTAGSARLVNGEVGLLLLAVKTPARHELPGPSEAHLNLQVDNLDATLADLARRGVPRLADKPLVAAIGPNMPIADPSGNLLYVIQLNSRKERLPRPRVLNYGITVPAMAEARKFYEGLLGFRVYSEAFYPPAIPYLPAGVLQVVLHESATKAVPAPPPDTAQMNLVMEVDDLGAACRDLASRGATVRAAEDGGALGRHAELLDPFGNVHLIVERSARTASREPR
ncbi:MAG TPA: VOC family protein [Thermoanaerobaculia bacterium]|nr:VOC family protein [Thermoanaerobaculia bacterium]